MSFVKNCRSSPFLGIFVVGVILFLPQVTLAQTFESPSQRTTLIELYSSEGCSSCPPAEDWVNHLKKEPGLWNDFIPVVFHVDYWDGLGWKDKFASARYTDRQRDYVSQWGSSTLYTPSYVTNGEAWDGWFYDEEIPKTTEETGVLRLETLSPGEYRLTFEPSPIARARNLKAFFAVLGFDIASRVKRGENAGRTLEHEFLVLDYQAKELPNHSYSVSFQLDRESLPTDSLGLAAWVSESNDPAPIQATGGYLD